MENINRAVVDVALASGAFETGFLSIADLAFEEEIRKYCVGNVCRCYNTTWACPPAVCTLEECRERCAAYDSMLLFNCKYLLKSSFDMKGMMAAMKEFKDLADRIDEKMRELPISFMILGNESCGRCKKCTWPDEPCRFPDKLHHSIEGYGFNVTKLAKAAGLHYNNGEKTVTYFGAVLYKEA